MLLIHMCFGLCNLGKYCTCYITSALIILHRQTRRFLLDSFHICYSKYPHILINPHKYPHITHLKGLSLDSEGFLRSVWCRWEAWGSQQQVGSGASSILAEAPLRSAAV